MTLPFTSEQFLHVFVLYNNSIWPLQILLLVMGIVAAVLCFRTKDLSILISTILAALWIWMGLVYHLMFFTVINPAAYLFGGVFVFQGVLFLVSGAIRREIIFGFRPGIRGSTGALLLAYGLIVYPILGHFLGHVFPSSPTFGAPCPTTVFTFGVLLWTRTRLPWYLVIIPCLWSIIGFSAAIQLGIREDTGLLVSGIAGTVLLLKRTPIGVRPAAA